MAFTFWPYRRHATTLNRFRGHVALLLDEAGSPLSRSHRLSVPMVFLAMVEPLFFGGGPADVPLSIAALTLTTIGLWLSSGQTLRWPASMAPPKAIGIGSLRA